MMQQQQAAQSAAHNAPVTAACVDIGGTKVAVTLANADGLIAASRQTEPTAKTGNNDALALQILRLIDQACAQIGAANSPQLRVGVSSCGPFEIVDGMVELAAPNVCGGLAGPERGLPNDWKTALLEAPIKAKYNHLVVVNDAIAALQAERRWGGLQGFDHCAYVTWSTGIGVGLCVDGQILRGKNGNAGHAGHMFVDDSDANALCGCGNKGDIEGLVAGNAMARRFAAQGFDDAAKLLDAAKAGDVLALKLINGVCESMGRMIYNLVVTLDLQRITVGGSVFWNNREFLLPLLRQHMSDKPVALMQGFELHPAGLGDKVGDFAALSLV